MDGKAGCTPEELEQVMEQYGTQVYRLAYARLRSVMDAEDVYQEVFLHYFRRGDPAWDDEHTKAFLLRVALCRCADVGRRRLRWGAVLPLEQIVEAAALEEPGRAAELWAAVARLRPKFRTVVHLYYAEG